MNRSGSRSPVASGHRRHQGKNVEVVDAVAVMETARSIKSLGEIELMKASVDVAQQGMRAMQTGNLRVRRDGECALVNFAPNQY